MRRFLSVLLGLVCLMSCIRNDIPYPRVQAAIAEMQVDGAKSVKIDADAREVIVVLEETADPAAVNITSVTFNDERVKSSLELTGMKDLSKPVVVTLSVYSEQQWTIRAEQPVERYFTIAGQAGSSVIDVANHRVLVKYPEGKGLKSLTVTSMKLGPADISAYFPEASALHDFSEPCTVLVTYRDVREEWLISVEEVELAVTMGRVDAWTRVAWLHASGSSDGKCGFMIRRKGSEEWTGAGDVKMENGSFTASVDGLEPLTAYEVYAYSGTDKTETVEFETEAEAQLPNAGFETFSNAESGKYYSFYDPASPDAVLQSKWWGSGNKGSTTVGASYAITMPELSTKVEGEASLKMASRYVIIKFAAGNVFSGEYYRTIGTSGGVIRMGRPFTLRPRKLTLWLKYDCGKIKKNTLGGVPDGETVNVGDNDRASVWIALGDWDYRKYGGSEDSPVEVNTTDRSTFFDPEGESVIAYGRYIVGESVGEWTKVEIPLEYVSTSRKPTHIIVSAAASMLGDYFTGSPDSVLWIDDLRLEY